MDNEKNFKDSLKTETNLYNISVCHLPLCSIREEISSRNCKYAEQRPVIFLSCADLAK